MGLEPAPLRGGVVPGAEVRASRGALRVQGGDAPGGDFLQLRQLLDVPRRRLETWLRIEAF